MNAGSPGGHVVRLGAMALLSLGLLALLSIGCRRGMPVYDPSPRMNAPGTLSGTVRGPEGTSSVEGRAVEVISVATGERQSTTTSNEGGFTFKVTPGKYRVEVTLLEGESVLKEPGIINVNRSDVDAHAHFVIGRVRALKPKYPTPSDRSLGSPVA
ncbi:MAG TPA: carboxypeptidase-like regulatory domain-containing protein [Vicinamibacterales bacterium]|nr:carboxypeptidase-like regulatory domain-containing protein [Vicinamibacterales bacterium]